MGQNTSMVAAVSARSQGDDSLHAPTNDTRPRTGSAGQQVARKLVSAMLEEIENTEDPKRRVELLHELAAVYEEQLGEPQHAFDAMLVAWAEDYTDVNTAKKLTRLSHRVRGWSELLTVARDALNSTHAPGPRLALCLQCADWYERGHRPDGAAACFQQVLAIEPDHPVALVRLATLQEGAEQWQAAFETLDHAVRVAREPGEKLALLLRIAQLFHGPLNNADKAIDAYERVLSSDRLNLVALRGLEDLYRAKERFRELPAVLRAQIRAASSNRERVDILVKLAHLWEHTFIRRDEALACLEDARSLDGTNRSVLQGLSGLYRQAQRWRELLATKEALLVLLDQGERNSTLRAIAALCTTELDDAPRAIRAYEEILSAHANDLDALRQLIPLYERTGNIHGRIKAMRRLANLEQEEGTRAELHLRLGDIYQRELRERGAALVEYTRAVELCPTRADMLRTLREAQLTSRDFAAAAKTLLREIDIAQTPAIRADRELSLAKLLNDELHEGDKALVFIERAYAHDPDQAQAALMLANACVRQRNWARALPILERLVRRARSVGSSENKDERELGAEGKKRAAVLLGEVAGRCGDHLQSAHGYELALELDPRDLQSALGAASAYFRLEDWPKVDASYLKVLNGWKTLTDQTRGEALRRRGLALLAQGQRRHAIVVLKSALKAAPQEPLTLRALVGLHVEAAEWKKVIRYKTMLAAIVPEEDRIRMHLEIAAVHRDKLKNPAGAIDVLRRAIQRAPNNHLLQHELLSLYQSEKRWEDAIDVLEAVAKWETRPAVAAKYVYTAGVIARDELKDRRGALAFFERSLDLHADHLKAFEAIDRLLTETKNWRQLERSYRKMLHRVIGREGTSLEVVQRLWHGLGIIYRDRIGDLVSAAQAFEQARDLQPDSDTKHIILAELYSRIPGELLKAIEGHRRRIERDVSNPVPYHLLYEIYREHGAIDRAWCVASALVCLGEADQEQRALYENFDEEPSFSGQRTTSEDWLLQLYHPDHDRTLATIFRCLAQPLHAHLFKGTAPLSRRNERYASNESSILSSMFDATAQVLGVDIHPFLAVHPSAPHGLRSERCPVPTTIAGRLVCERNDASELRFLLGHHLSYHRSEHYVRVLLPSRQELAAALLIAMRSIGKSDGAQANDNTWESIRRLTSADAIERIRKACTLFANRGEPANLKRFIQTAELTACRAGLLLSNSLPASLAMLDQLASAGSDDVSPTEKRAALLQFSVSEQYFHLRRKHGLAIEGPATPWDQQLQHAASA